MFRRYMLLGEAKPLWTFDHSVGVAEECERYARVEFDVKQDAAIVSFIH